MKSIDKPKNAIYNMTNMQQTKSNDKSMNMKTIFKRVDRIEKRPKNC